MTQNRLFIVKVGGSKGVDLGAVCADLAELAHAGRRWVLVHGGSHETNVIAERLVTRRSSSPLSLAIPAGARTGARWRSSRWSTAAR